MGRIIVTLQNRLNPRQYVTDRDGDRFQCPICKSWIDIKYFEFQGTTIPQIPQVCKKCNRNYSIAR